VFEDQSCTPFDWPNNTDQADGLCPTSLAAFLKIPAELPGVLINRDPQSPDDHIATNYDEPDWSQLANEAVYNADLDVTDVLPPPPEVIKIDDEDEYATLPLPFPLVIPKVEPDLTIPNVKHTPTIPSPLTDTQHKSAVHHTTLMSFISSQLLQKNAVSLHTTIILMQLARMWIWLFKMML
jgi:hypothetical protein